MKIKFFTLISDIDLWKLGHFNIRELGVPLEDTHFVQGASSVASGYKGLIDGKEADVFCFVHQDTRLHFDVLKVIPQYFENLPRVGVMGFVGSSAQLPDKFWWDSKPCYGSLCWAKEWTEEPTLKLNDLRYKIGDLTYNPVETVDGYCLFIKKDVFEKIGGFDPDYKWHGYDMDICMRSLAHGYQNYVIGQKTHHIGSSTHDEKAKSEALKIFTDKWEKFIRERRATVDMTPPTDVRELVPSSNQKWKRRGPSGLKICVYTICKNERKFVDRFVRFCEGADGIYVLDTGSTDGTPERLAELGVNVKIMPFESWKTIEEYDAILARGGRPWRFDLPRNINMEMMPEDTDVCVCIDLDEVLVPGWREIIEGVWTPGINHLDYQFAWGMKEPAPEDNEELYKRLQKKIETNVCFHYNKFHSRHGYIWVSPVHEKIVTTADFAGKERMASYRECLVCHYPDPSKSRGQYLALLQLGVMEDNNDVHSHFYYGRELTYYGKWAEAIPQLQRFLDHPNAKGWGPERGNACSLISIANMTLSNEQGIDENKKAELRKESIRWAMRACYEQGGQREAWVELSTRMRDLGDNPGSYWAAKMALKIDPIHCARGYLNNQNAWTWEPHDLAGVAAYWMGLKDESMIEEWAALEKNPWHERLISNFSLTQELCVPLEKQDGPPLVDVIILSYSKTRKEYDMTVRGINSLRHSSPDVPFNIIVVETNPNVLSEFGSFGAGVKVVTPNKAFNYNEFLNFGYAHCHKDSKYILILNNDVVVFCQAFIKRMIEGLETVQSVSAWGLRESSWGLLDSSKPLNVNFDINRALCGWCIMFDKAILNAIPFETLFPASYAWHGQDVYYGEQLRLRGYRHGLVTQAKALHLQMQSHHLLDEHLKPPQTRGDMLKRIGLAGKRCAEIGVDLGEFSKEILSNDPETLILVDPWLHQDEKLYPDPCNVTQMEFDQKAKHVVQTVGSDFRVVVRRTTSVDAARAIEDKSLDFVYIDAIHTKEACTEDLMTWYSKIKPGGWICGHDYQFEGVATAVGDFSREHGLQVSLITTEVTPSWGIQVK